MQISQVKQDIDEWIINFLAVPNEKLNGWSPCPYAHAAINKQSYKTFIGYDLETDLNDISTHCLKPDEVVIIAYSKNQYSNPDAFFESIKEINDFLLTNRNLIALGDHPNTVEEVNGVNFNQGKYALVLVQNLNDLNSKSKKVAKAGFYNNWPENYLTDIFLHREDPRASAK